MGDAAQGPEQIISLPRGGGALRGIGETFTADAQTGTGNHTIPIVVPAGRSGLSPSLELAYSTGNGNGNFGLGWTLSVPGISRKTSRGVPVYDDDKDVFILSGSEDLIVVGPTADGGVQYRPRTEGTFATIVHYRDAGQDYWIVTGKDGLVSRYGSLREADAPLDWRDPATITDATSPKHVFAWKLTETQDPLGNMIIYEYDTDEGEGRGHRWRQPLLRTIKYADYGDGLFLATVTFGDEPRADAFSSYTAGFEIRTSRRYSSITTRVHPAADVPVRRYELRYAQDPFNGMSLLQEVEVVGFDDAGAQQRDLPPLTLGYSAFDPAGRRFHPVGGAESPPVALSDPGYELVDVTGDGLPDVLQCNGVVRYWRNRGDGKFDQPRQMRDAPAGVHLGDPGVRLLDADGDGRADLVVSDASGSGYYPLRFGPVWGRFRRYPLAPSVGLSDRQVRLVDLTGDGVTDAVEATDRLQCFTNDPLRGWTGPRPARLPTVDPPPPLDLTDPRVRWADMTGDGLTDLVLVHSGIVEYWPNLGHGRWGSRIRMTESPRFQAGHDPARLLLGDVDGDGLADLVQVDGGEVTVWINRSGGAWGEPLTVRGLPADGWDMRLTDLLGTGTSGILWSQPARDSRRPSMYFLDLTGGVRPRLLNEVDNHIGAVTKISYTSSTEYSRRDDRDPATRWRTPLPFVVAVVAKVETIDEVAGSRLTTEYRYRHGYWDGHEREFRGFGCVEQFDTETSDERPGSDAASRVRPIAPEHLSPPTITRTWFHLGPVDVDADDEWIELDLSTEYWSDDPGLLGHTARVNAFLDKLPDRSGRRDALRALRGRLLRTELYAADDLARPYTVIETAYHLREEPAAGAHRVYFPFEVAHRTTQWERGDDPMTRYKLTGDYDDVGQPRRATTVAPPRRAARRRPIVAAVAGTVEPDTLEVLATHTRTTYASNPASPIRDRVAEVRSFELKAPPTVPESDENDVAGVMIDQFRVVEEVLATFDALDPADIEVTGHVVHHYDGPAYTGLAAGELGRYGLLTRSEALVHTDTILDHAYGDLRPDYLGGPEPLPAGAPAGFGMAIGYRQEPAGDVYMAGWYADTTRNAYDIQLATVANPLPGRGLVLGVQDPLGRETRVLPDTYWMFPQTLRDSAALETTAVYNYRVGQPGRVVDPNGHAMHYRYQGLGLLSAMFVESRDGEGGTEDEPGVRYQYNFSSTPVYVHTVKRIWHASANNSDEVFESREYSDGLGRLIQTRSQGDELAFGADGTDTGLLVTDPGGTSRAVPGEVSGPAVGLRVPGRVVVSGWKNYDNKGHVVGEYEPQLGRGWDFRATEHGKQVRTFYDPRGQVIRVLNPDGSQRRTVFGVPSDMADPDTLEPSPWTTTGYDENDLAPVSTSPSGESLAERVSEKHHHTPTTTVCDALGRQVCRIARGGSDTATWHVTRTHYDLRGNVLAMLDELGRTASAHAYDLTNRPLRGDSLDGGRAISVLDATGALVHTRDPRGAVALRTYDGLGRPIGVYARDKAGDPVTLRERLSYGDAGDPTQSAAERLAARAANRLGRLWRHHDEAGLVTIEDYDFTGPVTTKSRRVVRNAVIADADATGGWTADWSPSNAEAALETEGSVIASRHDALGRIVQLTAPADIAGHRAQIEPKYSRSGALQSVHVDGAPYVQLIAYDARGRRVLAVLGNGLITRYAYDADNFRLVRLRTEFGSVDDDVWTGSNAPLQELTHSYDLVGNITSIEERTTGCGVAGTAHGRDRLVRTFDYDAFSRLVSATGRACTSIARPRQPDDAVRCGSYAAPSATAPNQANAPDLTEGYKEAYTYDPAGNLLDLHYRPTTGVNPSGWHRFLGIGGLPLQDWADAVSNQLTSVHAGTIVSDFVYDDAGNLLTESSSRQFTWDHAGRMVGFQVKAGGETSISARYFYGADGMRVKKWVRRGNSAALDESTVYVGDLVEHHYWTKAGGGQSMLLHVMDASTRVASIRRGQEHPDDAGPKVRYNLDDHLGSAVLTVDDTGAWTNREEYFPYGETSFGSFARRRYRFTGKERDEESGLVYNGARYYYSGLARWTSCDPAGPADGSNLYRAYKNNPMRYQDQSGAASTPSEPKVSGTAATPASTSGSGELGRAFTFPESKIIGEPLGGLERGPIYSPGGTPLERPSVAGLPPVSLQGLPVDRIPDTATAEDVYRIALDPQKGLSAFGQIGAAASGIALLNGGAQAFMRFPWGPGRQLRIPPNWRLPRTPIRPLSPAKPTVESPALPVSPSRSAQLYGPYYHVAASVDDAAAIVNSSELWGEAPRNFFQSLSPAAKASTSAGLKMAGGPVSGRTVEFYTETPPTGGLPTDRWNSWQITRNLNLEVSAPIPPGLHLGTHPITGNDIAILQIVNARRLP